MAMRSLGVAMMRWRRVLIVAVCVAVAAVAVGVRIWWVNASNVSIPIERFGMGEWVELDGTYHFVANAMSHGYSVKVASVEVMSAQEYLERFAEDSLLVPDNPSEPQVVLELVIRNDRDVEVEVADQETVGGFDMVDTVLIPRNPGGMLYATDFYLLAESEGAFDSDAIFWIGVMPGTQYTMHVPYHFVRVVGADDSIGAEEPVSDTFDLVLGIAPVRREIEVTI